MAATQRRPSPTPPSGVRSSHIDGAWRRLALAFVNESQRWGMAELVAFCQTLLASGDLVPAEPLAGLLEVHEGGRALKLAVSPWAPLPDDSSLVPALLAEARRRVLARLRSLAGGDDRFLHAALYAGHVQRVPHRVGGPTWEPRLLEGESLGDWVLALFACDALEDRDTYDATLGVCERCAWVSLAGLEGHECGTRPTEPPASTREP